MVIEWIKIVMLFYLYKILQRNPSFQRERRTLVLELLLCRHKYRPPTGLRLTHHPMNTLKKKKKVKHYSVTEMGDSLRLLFTSNGIGDVHVIGVLRELESFPFSSNSTATIQLSSTHQKRWKRETKLAKLFMISDLNNSTPLLKTQLKTRLS